MPEEPSIDPIFDIQSSPPKLSKWEQFNYKLTQLELLAGRVTTGMVVSSPALIISEAVTGKTIDGTLPFIAGTLAYVTTRFRHDAQH